MRGGGEGEVESRVEKAREYFKTEKTERASMDVADSTSLKRAEVGSPAPAIGRIGAGHLAALSVQEGSPQHHR